MSATKSKYVALLRGINLGKRTVKMDALRATFESLGYTEVRTLLASGNVVFAAKEQDAAKLRTAIERQFAKDFGFDAHIILRSASQIAALVKAAPFKAVKAGPGVRMHITFLGAPAKASKAISEVKTNSWVAAATKDYLAWVVDPDGKTVDYMDILAEQFGEEITTRTWNTVEKIHALLSE
jgi:uncharacterized protein (DUF1697 family)